jgi:hypothetical protein
MGIIAALKLGLKTTARRSRLILYLWLANLFFGFLVVGPFVYVFGHDFSRSLEGERLLGGVDFLWLGDVILKYQDAFAGLSGWVLVPAVLYLVWSLFASGGIIGRVAAEEERTTLASFVADGCRYFFRFFRVDALSIPVFLVVFGGVYRLVGLPLASWSKTARTPWGDFWASGLRVLAFLILFSFVRMMFDYVKIRLAVDRSRKAFRAVVVTSGFLARRLAPAWALYLVIAFASILVSALFLAVSRLLSDGPAGLVLVVWLQALAAVRQGVRVLFLSSEYHYYKGNAR